MTISATFSIFAKVNALRERVSRLSQSVKKNPSLIKPKKVHLAAGLLIAATVFSNGLNLFFNAYLGRMLNFDNFAAISLVGSFTYLSAIVSKGFGTAVSSKSAFLTGKSDAVGAYSYWKYMRKYSWIVASAITLIWILLSPFLTTYFNADNILLFFLFGLVFLVSFALSVDQAFLSGKLLFGLLALVTIFEPILKNVLAYLAITLGYQDYAYAVIPISALFTFILGWVLVLIVTRKDKKNVTKKANSYKFPAKLFFTSLATGLSAVAFLSFDVILAAHFLSPTEAGKYALISLVGKMIYFMGAFAIPFIVPLVSRNEGKGIDTSNVFRLSLLATTGLTLVGFGLFALLGNITLPVIFGEKVTEILPYLITFSFGMVCFSIARVYVAYYLAKKLFTLPLISFAVTIAQIVLLFNFHTSINQFVIVMFFIGVVNLVAVSLLHVYAQYVKVFEQNVKDFIGLFAKTEFRKKQGAGKLAILIFNWRDTKHTWAGGAEVYINEVAKRWVKEGHNVTLFCGNDGHCLRNQTVDGIKIIRRGGFFTVYIWAVLYYFFRFRKNYDVIVDSENGIPFFSPLFSTRPVILLIHHVHQQVFRKSLVWPFSWFASMLESWLMPLVYRNRQVVTVSPSSQKEIMKHKLTKKSPTIIYNGVDTNVYKPGLKDRNPLVLYVGRLQQYKSLSVFLEAAKIILNQSPKVQFVIAGEGEDRKNLQKLTKKLGLSAHVTFLGYVSSSEKVTLLQKAWVFVNPSMMEGWGITTIEANACGTPVVASNVPGLKDSINNNQTGLLVKYGDHTAFAKKISSLLSSKQIRKRLSLASINWSQNFSWDKSAFVFLNVLMTEKQQVQEISRVKKVYYLFNRVTSLF